MSEHLEPIIVTADVRLRDAVLAAAVAAGAQPQTTTTASSVRGGSGRLVVVGLDRVEELARAGGHNLRVHLVGHPEQEAELCRWSAPLGASVTVVPDGIGWLTRLFAGGSVPDQARVICLIGGSGGVGTSSLAAGLARCEARAGRATLLLDLDPLSGGLDLLLAAERVSGWRWPRLARASGFLGALGAQLPSVDGVDVLAMARGGGELPGPEAVAAVLGSAMRTHESIVTDLGRDLGMPGREAVRVAAHCLLVSGADVRAVAASAQVLTRLGEAPVRVVVRKTRGAQLDPETVAETLGVPLAGVLPEDRELRAATERGEPLGRVAGKAWRRTCADLCAERAA